MIPTHTLLHRVNTLEAELRELRRQLVELEIEPPPNTTFEVILFRVGMEAVAVPHHIIDEVVPIAKLTPLPGASVCVLGTLDLRGTMIPVVDALTRLGVRAGRPALSDNVVVARIGDRQFGVVVQETIGVYQVDDNATSSAPAEVALAPYVLGMVFVDGQNLPLLSLARLIASSLKQDE